MRRPIAIALLLAPLGLGSCLGSTPPRANQTLSDVSSALVPVGAGLDFRSLTADRVVLIDLWATWCTACKESMPRVERLSQRHADTSFVVVGVNVGETAAAVETYTGEAEVSYPQYLDREFRFADLVGASEIPMFLVVDRAGTIVYRGAELDQGVLEALDRELAR